MKYVTRVEDYLPLPIPVSEASNRDQVVAFELHKTSVEKAGEKIPDDQVVRPIVPFDKCFEAFMEEEMV